MLDSLSLWLHETPLGETLLTMLISMLPVVELRGGLPAGVAMGLPIPVAFAASLVGNMIPVPFIILFVRPLFKWVRIHIPKLEGFISHLEARAEAKSADVLRYQTWGRCHRGLHHHAADARGHAFVLKERARRRSFLFLFSPNCNLFVTTFV